MLGLIEYVFSFDQNGGVVDNGPYYIDIFQGYAEETGGVISIQYRKKKNEAKEKFCWDLKPDQILKVIGCIWS